MADEKESKKAAPKGPNIILIAVFVFVASFGGSVLAFTILPKTVTVNQTIEQAKEPHEGAHLPIHNMGDFVVNLSDVSGSRFLKISITAKVYSEDFEEYEELGHEEKLAYHMRIEEDFEHQMPEVKDVIISTLSRKSSKEVIGYENKVALKAELKENLAHVLHGEFNLYDIYFTDFIVQ